MKLFFPVILSALLLGAAAHAQSDHITLLLLDGRTGEPIADGHLVAAIGKGSSKKRQDLTTDVNGRASVDVANDTHIEVSLIDPTPRFMGSILITATPGPMRYYQGKVAKLAKEGAVIPEHCRNVDVTRSPDQVVLIEHCDDRMSLLLLNGKTGEPIANEKLTVEYGLGTGISPQDEGTAPRGYTTDADGRALIDPGLRFRVWIDDLRICQGGTKHESMLYDGTIIVKHGIVAENVCGKARATKHPGELVLFAH